VTSAAPGLERALGTRVLAIDSQSAVSVHQRLLAIIPSQETKGAMWTNGGLLLQIATVLHGAGITRRVDTARLASRTGWRSLLARCPDAPSSDPGTTLAQRGHRQSLLASAYQRDTLVGAPDSQSVYLAFRGFSDTALLARLSDHLIAYVNRRTQSG